MISTASAALAILAYAAAVDAQVAPGERPMISRQSAVTAMPRGAPPGAFVVTFAAPRAVRLSWTAPDGAIGYVVSRAPSSAGPWTTLNTAPLIATSYEDQSVSPKTAYVYRVAARYADKADGATPSASVFTPCDKYCVIGDCAPRPATKLQIVEGSVGSGSQWRFTLKVLAFDAATGAPLAGTVVVNNVTGSIGATITYVPCGSGGKAGSVPAEVVPCRARVSIPGRFVTTIVTSG